MHYRKLYEIVTQQKIPTGFEVHHIDLNHYNDDINNLVAIPKELHKKFHKYINSIESCRVVNDFKFDDLYKIGGNFNLDWDLITQDLIEVLPIMREIHKYILFKESRLASIQCKLSLERSIS